MYVGVCRKFSLGMGQISTRMTHLCIIEFPCLWKCMLFRDVTIGKTAVLPKLLVALTLISIRGRHIASPTWALSHLTNIMVTPLIVRTIYLSTCGFFSMLGHDFLSPTTFTKLASDAHITMSSPRRCTTTPFVKNNCQITYGRYLRKE